MSKSQAHCIEMAYSWHLQENLQGHLQPSISSYIQIEQKKFELELATCSSFQVIRLVCTLLTVYASMTAL